MLESRKIPVYFLMFLDVHNSSINLPNRASPCLFLHFYLKLSLKLERIYCICPIQKMFHMLQDDFGRQRKCISKIKGKESYVT